LERDEEMCCIGAPTESSTFFVVSMRKAQPLPNPLHDSPLHSATTQTKQKKTQLLTNKQQPQPPPQLHPPGKATPLKTYSHKPEMEGQTIPTSELQYAQTRFYSPAAFSSGR